MDKRNKLAGFTLVELLVVVAIIALLVGIVVPSIGLARIQAKKAATQALLSTLEKGCVAFSGELNEYPRSAGYNPFEASTYSGSPSVALSGAQWLVLELAGADLRGQIAVDRHRNYDTDGSGQIDAVDWINYYDPDSAWRQGPGSTAHRFGPYVELEGDRLKTPVQFGGTLPPALDPNAGESGASPFNNGRLPFVIDAFDYPVLYYVANPHAKRPFTDPDSINGSTGKPWPGRYDQTDNAAFTGSEFTSDLGLDLGAGEVDSGTGQYHWLYELGWTYASATSPPLDKTFADALFDRAVFEQGDGLTGRVWPRNADTCVLISAGNDGIYGTDDDVTNF